MDSGARGLAQAPAEPLPPFVTSDRLLSTTGPTDLNIRDLKKKTPNYLLSQGLDELANVRHSEHLTHRSVYKSSDGREREGSALPERRGQAGNASGRRWTVAEEERVGWGGTRC